MKVFVTFSITFLKLIGKIYYATVIIQLTSRKIRMKIFKTEINND